ncbi:MAG: hypothetical protein HYS27_09405 [Deltaproteobacteria bacterium]|nr:hypothetical protein [Deltaproteobacteria bacterium]
MRALLLITPALALALTACMVERDYTDPYQAIPDVGGDEWGEGSDLPIRSGWVRGDLGQVRDFDAAANESYGYTDGSYSNVTVTAYDAQERMGMIIVDLSGADLRSVRAGSYRFGDLSADSVGGGTLSVIGCSSSTDTYFDAPANEGTVVITDTTEGRQVDVEAQLPTDDGMGSTEATGSFVISRQ